LIANPGGPSPLAYPVGIFGFIECHGGGICKRQHRREHNSGDRAPITHDNLSE
jgi:hypothetical protein